VGLDKLLENTPESYYWIGFLLADGYIDHDGRGGVQLAEREK
jgi:hypothetical protein